LNVALAMDSNTLNTVYSLMYKNYLPEIDLSTEENRPEAWSS